jgi:hypothetical protein
LVGKLCCIFIPLFKNIICIKLFIKYRIQNQGNIFFFILPLFFWYSRKESILMLDARSPIRAGIGPPAGRRGRLRGHDDIFIYLILHPLLSFPRKRKSRK